MKKVKKVVKNGMVAVCISPGFGAGWSTWEEVSPFEPKVVDMILAGRQKDIDKEWCKTQLGLDNVYCGGAEDLEVVWIKEGEEFYIDEYDGAESIVSNENLTLKA